MTLKLKGEENLAISLRAAGNLLKDRTAPMLERFYADVESNYNTSKKGKVRRLFDTMLESIEDSVKFFNVLGQRGGLLSQAELENELSRKNDSFRGDVSQFSTGLKNELTIDDLMQHMDVITIVYGLNFVEIVNNFTVKRDEKVAELLNSTAIGTWGSVLRVDAFKGHKYVLLELDPQLRQELEKMKYLTDSGLDDEGKMNRFVQYGSELQSNFMMENLPSVFDARFEPNDSLQEAKALIPRITEQTVNYNKKSLAAMAVEELNLDL